jgi:SHAQKYF class myb-like DNA-binding protein
MQPEIKKSDAFINGNCKPKPKFILESNHSSNIQKQNKNLRCPKPEKVIFGLIRGETPNPTNEVSIEVESSPIKVNKDKRKRKAGTYFNTGRWNKEEHQKFIEALLKHGNDWKSVQKYVGSRSSTQARSHAQKFFVKIGKIKIENLSLDFENNSLRSLNIMANNLNRDQMGRAIQSLNEKAFDKKFNGNRDDDEENEDSEDISNSERSIISKNNSECFTILSDTNKETLHSNNLNDQSNSFIFTNR